MVRSMGSLSDENSVNEPTGEAFSSVVRRNRGKRAKRIKGTASKAPTHNEPSASKVPRNDRRCSSKGWAVENFHRGVFPASSAPIFIEPSRGRVPPCEWRTQSQRPPNQRKLFHFFGSCRM